MVEFFYRYSGLKQRMIAERFEGWDEGFGEPRSQTHL